MIALFKGQYTIEDFKYLEKILDAVIYNRPFCDGDCDNCKNIRSCTDLIRLHRYVYDAILDGENKKKIVDI